jgi:hypothetical protein
MRKLAAFVVITSIGVGSVYLSSGVSFAQPKKQSCSLAQCMDQCQKDAGTVSTGRGDKGCAGYCQKKGCT